MPTADLTPAQLDAAAAAPFEAVQTRKKVVRIADLSVRFYTADASAGALAGKYVADVDLGDGLPVTIAIDDAAVLAPAETAGVVRVLKRFIVEARARKAVTP